MAIFRLLQLVELRMGNWTPSIVPSDDQTVYLVVDDFGRHGRAWRETDVEKTDLETVISDMLEGQYSDPVRVVGFNTAEGWSRDVSADVAQEIRYRCDRWGVIVLPELESFMERHERRDRAQLRLV
jgi:hypothetical protein